MNSENHGGKQPRYGGKQPRYGGKQPRRVVEESEEDDEEEPEEEEPVEEEEEEEEEDDEEEADSDEDFGVSNKRKAKGSKGNKPAKKAATNKKIKSQTLDSSSEEEVNGEEEEDEEDDGEFNPNKLYLDQADRQKLAAMNEFERESILLERHEKRLKELARKRTMRDLRLRKKEAVKKQTESEKQKIRPEKPKNRRATSEESKAMKTKKSLQDMARKKKQAAVSSEEEEESASGMSDESEEEEEEVEEEEVRSRKTQSVQRREEEDEEAWPSKENGGITVDDINLIRIPRHFLEKQSEEPYLERAIKGCVVRFLIGEYNGAAIYRLCEVRGIEPAPKPYKLPGAEKRTANILLKIKHGDNDTLGRIDKVSNHRVTELELNKWITQMKDSRQSTLTPLECRRRHDRLKEITTNHTYTAEEVFAMNERRIKTAILSGTQNKAMFRIKYTNDMAIQQEILESALTKLDRLGDNGSRDEIEQLEDKVSRAEQTIANLKEEMRLTNEHTELEKKAYSKADKLSNVNSRNKGINVGVDAVDSRDTLQEEFLGTGDSQNAIFRTKRTKMTDLWKTSNNDKTKSAAMSEADVVSKFFGNSNSHHNLAQVEAPVVVIPKSKTGLRRPVEGTTRQRRGISLQAYLEKAHIQKQ